MPEKKFTCPICESAENSFKVSEIYIQSLVRLKHGDKAIAPTIDRLQAEIPEERRDKLKGSRYYRQLMESFAPPQGGTMTTRAINPDWIAFSMLILSLFFLYQIYTTQPGVFWYMVGFAIIAFAAYGLFRKKIFEKYLSQKTEQSGSQEIVEKAVGIWMKLYYCTKDNIVYGGKKGNAIPIDQMRSYLLESAKSK